MGQKINRSTGRSVGRNRAIVSEPLEARRLFSGEGFPYGTFAIDDAVVLEGTGGISQIGVTVHYQASFPLPASVSYTTTSGTAVAGDDFQTTSGTLYFGLNAQEGFGGSEETITLDIVTDAIDEMDEQFTVTLSTADFGTIEDGEAVVTITDDDASPTLGSISGITFNDSNANGVYDGGDSLGENKTLWLDLDQDNQLDADEPSYVTHFDGAWSFTGLEAGTYQVRRKYPAGYVPSTPQPLAVNLAAGQNASGYEIGTKRATNNTAALKGFTYTDENRNGKFDAGDDTSSGKTVFLDLDSDNKLDANEQRTTTGAGGAWEFKNLPAGEYRVRRVYPSTYERSGPLVDVTLAAGQTKSNLAIGSKKILNGSLVASRGMQSGVAVNDREETIAAAVFSERELTLV